MRGDAKYKNPYKSSLLLLINNYGTHISWYQLYISKVFVRNPG